jgi:glycosyltransferase involved in cell wall biosynthesis
MRVDVRMVRRMHILFLTDNFPPEVNAPASRTFEHCREWVRLGHQVTVITCVPNSPNGKIFEGYRNHMRQTEEMEGIRVIRVWSYITANEGFLRRTLDYMSYMVSATVASVFVGKVDVVIGTSPHFFTACGAYAVSWIKRRPFIFELRDLWPESIKAVGVMSDGLALRMLERIELFLYRRAARLVTVTQSFKHNLARRGINPAKIEVITNGVDIGRFKPRPRDAKLSQTLGLEGKFVAGYVGTHGMAHALETVLEAARQLQSEPGGDRFRFLLLGDGARKRHLVEQARAMGLGNVVFVDTVPKDEVAHYWSLIDASIIHLRKTELFTTVIPSKLFECLGMGIPVLHGVEGESAEIVERESVGLAFEPENAAELCRGLERLAGDPALRARLRENCLAAAPRYDRRIMAERMLEVLLSCAGGKDIITGLIESEK